MIKKNIGIIIQGPINDVSISNIPIYKEYGEVVYSTWADSCSVENATKIKQIYDFGAKFVSLPNQLVSHRVYNMQNIFYQAYSTYYGCLLLSDVDYVIKVRSDEKYTNLTTLISKLDEKKIITSNIFFRRYDTYPYHISDHIIAGQKKTITEIFNELIVMLTSDRSYFHSRLKYLLGLPQKRFLVAEQLITMASMAVLNTSTIPINFYDRNFCINFMQKYFDIVDIRNLGDFVVSFKNRKNIRISTTNFDDIYDSKRDINSIENYI